MSIFHKFTETVFLKEDFELENKLNKLKELVEKYPNNKEIKDELKKTEYGLKGEKEVEFYLKNANIGMYVLHDINLAIDDLKAQIDYIVITPAKCYFIECKDMVGEIIIDSTGQFISEYDGKRKAIESPLRQSQRHREVLLKIMNSNSRGILDIFFNEKSFKNYFDSIVVFSNQNAIINTDNAPEDIKKKVIRVEDLINYMQADIDAVDMKDSKKSMKDLAERLLKRNVKEKIDYGKRFNLDMICPICHGKLVERSGPYSKFIGCSNYPNCTYKIKKDE